MMIPSDKNQQDDIEKREEQRRNDWIDKRNEWKKDKKNADKPLQNHTQSTKGNTS